MGLGVGGQLTVGDCPFGQSFSAEETPPSFLGWMCKNWSESSNGGAETTQPLECNDLFDNEVSKGFGETAIHPEQVQISGTVA